MDYTRKWVKTRHQDRIIRPPEFAARRPSIPAKAKSPLIFRIASKSRTQLGRLQVGTLQLFDVRGDAEMAHAQTTKIEAATNACKKIARLCVTEGNASSARLGQQKIYNQNRSLASSVAPAITWRMNFSSLAQTAVTGKPTRRELASALWTLTSFRRALRPRLSRVTSQTLAC